MTDIERAIAKAREELSQFNRKYFPNVVAEREAALNVIEAADRQNRWQLEHAVYDIHFADAVHNALDAFARAVLGQTDANGGE